MLLLSAAAVAFAALSHSLRSEDGGSLILVLGFGLVGLVVAMRRPQNPIGWSLLGFGVLLALDAAASSYLVLDYRHHHGSLPLGAVAVLLQPAWAPAIVLLALSILLFPDGELPAGWWRIPIGALLTVAGLWLAGAFAISVDAIATHDIEVDSTGNLIQGNHPTGAWAWWGVSQDVFFALLLVVGLARLVGQIPAYRRATGIRRAQLKWLLIGAATAILGGVAAAASPGGSAVLAVVAHLGTIALLALPLSIGFGILRYRLYDIDRLVSRTLAYALLTGMLVGVFAGLVLLTTRVLPFSSPVGVAASTLAAAALFSPLRRQTQRLVDRRFNRARYDAEATVAAFGKRLRETVDLDTVRRELLLTAAGAVEPAHAALWIMPSGSGSER